MACVNWPQGCNYKTPRGVPTEEQVLHVLELHKILCKRKANDHLMSKVGGSSQHGLLKPGEKYEKIIGGGGLQGVKIDQASFKIGNKFIDLEMDFKGTYKEPDPDHEVRAKTFYDLEIGVEETILGTISHKKRMFTFGYWPNQGGGGPCPKVLALFFKYQLLIPKISKVLF